MSHIFEALFSVVLSSIENAATVAIFTPPHPLLVVTASAGIEIDFISGYSFYHSAHVVVVT